MPSYICPVCSKKRYSYQNSLQCDTCSGWVHHGNILQCSGLTDIEFHEHTIDPDKPFECDHCVGKRIADENNSNFTRLPFPIECEGNIFGKPEEKLKPDISSMTPSQLKQFTRQCESIQSQLNSEDDSDDLFTSVINSKYYNIKQFNSLKPDELSSFGLLHVNIASLNKHFEELNEVLSRLKFSFDVIGISEHKINNNNPPSNNISHWLQ